MKALVTGATGFIGGALARRLLYEGGTVRCLVRTPNRARHLERAGARLVTGDIEAPQTLPKAMAGIDTLFHAAASVDVIQPDRDAILRTNVQGTENVLAAAKAAQVRRVVYFSSVAALGRKHKDADESVWNDGAYASTYEESKHKAEQVALRYGQNGLHIVHVLPSIVLGPGDPKSGSFFQRYLRREIPARPWRDGSASFVYIDDLVDGVLLAHERGRANERYIFSQATWTTSHVMAELERASGVPPPRRVPRWLALLGAGVEERRARRAHRPPRISREAVRLATRKFGYSGERARRELGWRPVEFESRFRSVVAHWQGVVRNGQAK